jgi:hypothetical protein
MLLTAHPQQRQPGLFTHPEQLHTHSHTQLPSPLSHSLHIVLYVERERVRVVATTVLLLSSPFPRTINHHHGLITKRRCS